MVKFIQPRKKERMIEMKIIKKSVLVLMIALVALTAFASKSSAMTKEELKEYMLGDNGIAGSNLHARSADKVKIERFINGNDITDEQAGQIKEKIDEAVALMTADGATHPNALSSKEKKNKLLGLAQQAAGVLGLTVSYNADDESLDIYKDGELYDTLDWGITGAATTVTGGSSAQSTLSSDPHLAQTGATNYGYVALVGVVLVAGITLVVARKNASKANA